MKLTESMLRRIIREELEGQLSSIPQQSLVILHIISKMSEGVPQSVSDESIAYNYYYKYLPASKGKRTRIEAEPTEKQLNEIEKFMQPLIKNGFVEKDDYLFMISDKGENYIHSSGNRQIQNILDSIEGFEMA
jgi:hypothetical protein